MDDHLFVYGSLRKDARHAMYRVLTQYAHPAGPASMAGGLYDLGAYPGAVAGVAEGGRVHGELYRFDLASPLLGLLDRYEGCAPESPRPHEFRRARAEVTPDGAAPLTSWVYLFALPLDGVPRIASGDYLARDE